MNRPGPPMKRIANEAEYIAYIIEVIKPPITVNATAMLNNYGRPKEYPCLVGAVKMDMAWDYDFSFTYRADIERCLRMLDGTET